MRRPQVDVLKRTFVDVIYRFNCMASSLPVLLAWVVDIEEFALFTV